MGRRGRPPMGFAGGPAVRGGKRIQEQKFGPGARAMVADAHALAGEGRLPEATSAFAKVAGIARERGLHRMATFLGLQAALCAAKAGDQDGFVQNAEHAIGTAKLEGDAGFSARVFGSLVVALAETPFAAGSASFADAVTEAVGVRPSVAIAEAATAEASRSWRRHLPDACDGCGGAVSGADIVFTEDGTADCTWCGSVLTT